MNIVIVGGGIAGTGAAEEIRKRLPEANITIIEQEEHPCYSRVLLPHYVKAKIAREKVFLKTFAWYEEQKIEFLPGTLAVQIDIKNKFVRASNDREYPFDKLLITTGTEVRLFEGDMRGVAYFGNLDDADQIVGMLSELQTRKTDERRAFVYGGGFISLEFANMFAHFGVSYGIAMRGTGFWSNMLSLESQKVLADHARAHGVEIYANETMPELLGEKELTGVRLQDGREISAGMLGIGIGSSAKNPVLVEAGIPLEEGVLANEYLETGLPDVYTAGDAAQFADMHVGRQLRYGNWMNAQMQGRAVGKTMAGERTAFSLASSYATNLLGMHVVFVGDTSRAAADRVVQIRAEATVAEEHFIRNGKLVGVVLIGDVTKRTALNKMIGQPYEA